jgi:electron-transferring-flavoprotein dehydrogenase
MHYDIIIIGAGPAGLSAAIRLKQLKPELSICLLEKGAEIGAHLLSGAVLEPRALNELLPGWQELDAPVTTTVTQEEFLCLTARHAIKLPTPRSLHNANNHIISLGLLCRWLARQAENLGVEIFAGFAAKELLIDETDTVVGVVTGELGLDKQGQAKESYQPGVEIRASYTLIAEGCRGSLAKQLIQKYALAQNSQPQTYGLGIKELWEVDSKPYKLGKVQHSIGWPLSQDTFGGGFVYHLPDNKVAVGLVVGLDYQNPYLSPFEEFQRFKTHPALAALLSGGKRLAYGARTISEGGIQALPNPSFPGGLLLGDSAGFVNVPKIKGIHTAMKSGMLAAETIVEAFAAKLRVPTGYHQKITDSWLGQELYRVRNIRPSFKYGLAFGLCYSAIDIYLLRGRAPWTFKTHADHTRLIKATKAKPLVYAKADQRLTFDRLSSVYLSNTLHEEDQPCHLQLKNPSLALSVNLAEYAAPETRYCPAAVYEIVQEQAGPRLQINATNCVHCKACDIKDPTQNINWVPPEGSGGPNYETM